jgi:hypothetical protein
LSATFPSGNYELRAEKSGYGFLASAGSTGGTVIKSDYNALFRMVIAIPSSATTHVTDANFTAFRPGDKIVSVPRTGQTTSYAVGDDASAQQGVAWPTTRFTDNQDGTVTDGLTGLIWLKNAGCMTAMIWSDALQSANQLASGTCGLTDGSTAGTWRMPNIGELESLIDVSQSSPAVSAGHPFANVAATYWSSTTYRGDPTEAWVIRFTDSRYINDGVNNVKAGSLHALWAVKSSGTAGAVSLPGTGQLIVFANRDDASLHSGLQLTSPRFIDNGDGTIADTVTGLTWMKRADCIHQTWSAAMTAINSLASGQCELSDGSTAGQWRMPNRNEMLSLLDRAETNQALRFNTVFFKSDGTVDQPAIFNTFPEFEFYWTSTTNFTDLTEAWTVFSCDGGVYNIAKANIGYSLAVR